MSYVDDIYKDSEARKTMEQRKKVNFVSWGERNADSGKQWCPVCNVVLLYRENGAIAFCKSCGQETPIGQIRAVKKLKSKFGDISNPGPMIFSKDRRSKHDSTINDSVNPELSEEDKADLRAAGYMV